MENRLATNRIGQACTAFDLAGEARVRLSYAYPDPFFACSSTNRFHPKLNAKLTLSADALFRTVQDLTLLCFIIVDHPNLQISVHSGIAQMVVQY